jgi:CheY-like chemotaxis protein
VRQHDRVTAIRVLVVDDLEDVRAVVRLALELDGRYQVVGEAADGAAGVDAAASLQPDVVLLDRSMPVLDGLSALPRIRQAAPGAAVILYTSDNDEGLRQAAVAAGAVDLVSKERSVAQLGGLVADALVRSASRRVGELAVHVGPVPSSAALAWITNTTAIVHAVRAAPDLPDVAIADEVYETFLRYLDAWREIAEDGDEFTWAARATAEEVERLIEAWASIDRIDDDQLRTLGCDWSAPLGRSFYESLTTAVLRALADHERTVSLARRLEPQWAPQA